MNNNMKELWKNIKGYEDRYQISNLGSVKSLTRNAKHNCKKGTILLKGKILKDWKTNNRYKMVVLVKPGTRKYFLVHRLLAQAFIPNLENKRCVHHKDDDKTNNIINNLEWLTHAENNKHAYQSGLRISAWLGKFGKDHHSSKVVLQYTKNGKFVNKFYGAADASRKTGILKQGIYHVLKGKRKTAGDYLWRYAE